MEKEIKATPYALIQICDSCQSGEMLPTGEIKYPGPVWFEHRCNKCGLKRFFSDKYPLIKYRLDV